MNDSAYNELKKNYQELLEENKKLKQRIMELQIGNVYDVAPDHPFLKQSLSVSSPSEHQAHFEIENRINKYAPNCDDPIDKNSYASNQK